MPQYSTALSHIVLAGTSIYCLIATKPGTNCSNAVFGTIAFNSILGVWRWGNPSYGDNVDKLYKFTTLLQDLISLPCTCAHIWLRYGYMRELAYAHVIVSLVPVAAYLADKSSSTEFADSVLTVNCISLGVVSFLHQNYYGVAAAVSFFLGYFGIKRDCLDINNRSSIDLPTQDLYSYAMCFYAFFALRAMQDMALNV